MALRFVFKDEPALMILNQSTTVAKQIKWSVVLWNLDDPKVYSPQREPNPDNHEPLPIPT